MTQGNIYKLPFPDEDTYDRVICSEVMEHVHSYTNAAKAELARVTKPGGKLAITIPTATSEHLYLRLGDEYFESPGGHIRIFKPRALAKGLAQAGLDTSGGRLRPRLPHALLGAALGHAPAGRGRERDRSRLSRLS